ncbi:hypothetical protein CKK33_01300 [Mucilaginibacter sp. MD40]|uniref:hypothetical protein n=1 Tax=Mucilaginibacter sp. MD40 TaxID=2029590 RepID=UPI000BAC83C4|nr:hypothetical protein [Mucilaginibacter sp. MD40]PAW92203.1 hypothetical protein CKK33_01300 [Mucilaginibacter sp. MD40]
MKPVSYFFTIITCGIICFAVTSFTIKENYVISDLGHFWEAVDSLKDAQTREDSIAIIQKYYLDRMSTEGKMFISIRGYTAPELVNTIRRYPKYLKQVRLKTENISAYTAMLDSGFAKMKAAIPDYKVPRVCFAIGCFRGGGTSEGNLILMGTEIALATSDMDFSELKGNLRTALLKGINLKELVMHESVHGQQFHKKDDNLLAIAMREGCANFLSTYILNDGHLPGLDQYGLENECELWNKFKSGINSEDVSQWFYNTGTIKNKPADLGYFIGMRICEAYYNRQADKQQAIKTLLDRAKYKEVLEQSGYDGHCDNVKADK